MTEEQTDQANLDKTGSAGVGGEAVKTEPAANVASAGEVQPRQRGNNKERQRLTAEEEARAEERARANDPSRMPAAADQTGVVEASHDNPGRTGFDRNAQSDKVERELEHRSRHNEEGHAKNQRAIAEAAKGKPPAPTAPQTGKSRDALINTPVIDKNGNKTWKL